MNSSEKIFDEILDDLAYLQGKLKDEPAVKRLYSKTYELGLRKGLISADN